MGEIRVHHPLVANLPEHASLCHENCEELAGWEPAESGRATRCGPAGEFLSGLVELHHAPRGDVGHPEGVIAPSRPFEETEAAADEYWLHQCHLVSRSGRHMVPGPSASNSGLWRCSDSIVSYHLWIKQAVD